MSADARKLPFVWLLGQDYTQRLYLKFWLMTSGIYAVILLMHGYGEFARLIDAGPTLYLRMLVPVGALLFYLAIRSGWSRRFRDPSLTMAQMAFGLLMLGQANLLIPEVRGWLLICSPLVLLFGAFSLRPVQSQRMGWFAVFVMALDTGLAHWLKLSVMNVQLELVMVLITAMCLLVAAHMAGRLSDLRYQLQSQKKQLESALQDNLKLARQDTLTGLPNRRHVEELMAYEERRAQRQPIATCVGILDIDHFKRINDSFGHPAGDDVLRLFARQSAARLRDKDVLARWGGEEFLVLMPETALLEGELVLGRLRAHLSQPEVWAEQPQLQVTFSAGIVAYQNAESAAQAVARADAALYQAKSRGRNQTVVA